MGRKRKNNDDVMSTSDAGKLGGDATMDKYGEDFYSEIGRQQNSDSEGQDNEGNFKNRPKTDVKRAGRKGGLSASNN